MSFVHRSHLIAHRGPTEWLTDWVTAASFEPRATSHEPPCVGAHAVSLRGGAAGAPVGPRRCLALGGGCRPPIAARDSPPCHRASPTRRYPSTLSRAVSRCVLSFSIHCSSFAVVCRASCGKRFRAWFSSLSFCFPKTWEHWKIANRICNPCCSLPLPGDSSAVDVSEVSTERCWALGWSKCYRSYASVSKPEICEVSATCFRRVVYFEKWQGILQRLCTLSKTAFQLVLKSILSGVISYIKLRADISRWTILFAFL